MQLGRLFHRFGNPLQLPSVLQADYNTFAQHFVMMFVPEILSSTSGRSNQAWLSKKCQYQMITFFTEGYVLFCLWMGFY